jgi:hypothetical protein
MPKQLRQGAHRECVMPSTASTPKKHEAAIDPELAGCAYAGAGAAIGTVYRRRLAALQRFTRSPR